MPPLSPERWRVLRPHLDRALDLTPEERGPWLAALRTGDPGLAADIEALLEQHAALDDTGLLSSDTAPMPALGSLAGLAVGAYTLREQIGQGGMGQVWLADRSDGRFEGKAAVKLLNASLMGRDAEARFKLEGSFLARLRHPCIASLIDAGMTSMGQPYLVLEHVDGEPIDIYCDSRNLAIDARIRLFLDVLSAVAFAHVNLVVHRDLKPPNILVGKDGRVRLLDFGIAKLLEPEGAKGAGAPLTREGERVLTPEYAAPEQLSGGAVTTATDVYALGVILYLLLTGQHPAGGFAASPVELMKSVVDREPPRVSDAVVTAAFLSREALEETAARRDANPGRLRRTLRGDLDNIVARALRKDPGERYPSVESLAADLRRYLDNEPVSARPDSLPYRTFKFIRRNRGGVAAAGLVAAAVVAGTAGVAWQAREAGRQRDSAETQLARTTAANEFITYLLSVAAPNGARFTVGELLDQGEALIDRQFADDDMLRAEMLVVIAQEYMLSERWDRATSILERAAAIAGPEADPALAARVQCQLAFLKVINGDLPGGEAMMSQALAELPDTRQYDMQRAECLIRRSELGYFNGDGDAMIRNSTRAMEILARGRSASSIRRVDALGCQAYGYYLTRRNREAEETFAQVMKALEQAGRERTLAAADTLNNWSLVYFLGDVSRAEPLSRRVVELRRAIEGGGTVAPTTTYNLAGALVELARYDEAAALLEETARTAAERQEQRIQTDAMMQLADVYIELGDLARAAAQLDTLKPFVDGPRFTNFRRAVLTYYHGRLAQASGDHVTARTRYAHAVEVFEKAKAKIAMSVRALIGLALSELALGETEAAAAAADRALALAESFVEKDAPSYLVGRSLAARAEILAARGAAGEARTVFEAAARHLERTLGAGHPATRDALQRASS